VAGLDDEGRPQLAVPRSYSFAQAATDMVMSGTMPREEIELRQAPGMCLSSGETTLLALPNGLEMSRPASPRLVSR